MGAVVPIGLSKSRYTAFFIWFFKWRTMTITPKDIQTLSQLSHIALTEAESTATLQYLNDFFNTVVAPMQAVDTQGVEPLAHPTDVLQAVALRLQDDIASEPNQREASQQSAPQVQDGLFIVPQVIE